MLDVLFVNKFGPGGNAITGLTAAELAGFLKQAGLNVGFLCMRANYRANRQSAEVPTSFAVWQMRSLYDGDRRWLRFLAGLIDGFRLFTRAQRLKSRVIVVMTEPPLLFLHFQLWRHFCVARLGYYTMDLYPDAFAANGIVHPSNLLYRFLMDLAYRSPPDFVIALGHAQRRFVSEKFHGKLLDSFVDPCGLLPAISRRLQYVQFTRISFGYGGNLGEAHDSEFIIKFALALDPAKHILYLSVYGSKSQQVLSVVKDLKAVVVLPILTHSEIANIQINIVTLLPAWSHVCVPSKAVTAISCGSAVLLNCSKVTDAWQMFSDAAWIIEPANDYESQIKSFLGDLSIDSISVKRRAAALLARSISDEREREYSKIASYLRKFRSQ